MSSNTTTMISTQAEPPYHVGSTFGALYVGVVIASILFGLTCLQTFVYFQRHRTQGIVGYKMIFLGLWLLDGFHVGLLSHTVWYYLVEQYGNPLALDNLVWCFRLQIPIAFVVVVFVHCLYAHRIWTLNKGRNILLPMAVTTLVVVNIGLLIGIPYYIYRAAVWEDMKNNMWALFMGLSSLAVTDLVIALSMCYLLASSRTGFTRTDMKIKMLIIYTVSTGCMTSCCSITTMITDAVMPQNFIFIAFEMMLVKLYSNSFMAMMNARYYQGSDETSGPFLNPIGVSTKRSLQQDCEHQIMFARNSEISGDTMSKLRDETTNPGHTHETVSMELGEHSCQRIDIIV